MPRFPAVTTRKIVHYPRNPAMKVKPHVLRLTDCGRRAQGRAISDCIYLVTCAKCREVIKKRTSRARKERLRQ